MKVALVCLIILYILRESYGYKYCSYSRYNTILRKTVTYYYSCSSNQYCCGVRSCCTYVYARWYLWFVISAIFLFVFILWWYYRYRYRPRHIIVRQTTGVITPGAPGVIAGGGVNVVRVNAPYPTYPHPGTVTVLPGSGNLHNAAYPPPAYGPVQTYHPPPPAYSSVVKTSATVTSSTN